MCLCVCQCIYDVSPFFAGIIQAGQVQTRQDARPHQVGQTRRAGPGPDALPRRLDGDETRRHAQALRPQEVRLGPRRQRRVLRGSPPV